MSTYGRLWAEVDRIRTNLKEIARVHQPFQLPKDHPLYAWLPGANMPRLPSFMFLVDTNTLAEARRSVTILKSQLDSLLSQWEELEEEMAKCDDHTGEP